MKNIWNLSMAQFLWYDCTFKKQCTVPVTLTFDIFQWIENNPIGILYKFQIDIYSDSREIKYQNIGRTHRQTDRQTDRQTHRQTDRVKTIPRNPLRRRGNDHIIYQHLQQSNSWTVMMWNSLGYSHVSSERAYILQIRQMMFHINYIHAYALYVYDLRMTRYIILSKC